MFSWEDFALLYFSISMFINGSLFIPQIIKLLRHKSAENLSLIMFAGFSVIQFSVILHAYFQRDVVLLLGTGYGFITCGLLVLLILYYRLKTR